ncbi:MAG: PQQ-binding-like beta-propeller repeat protein, partial [Planctomycetes bacterium]|nr:PQQ-binding-like beta-propeller repeat protein [Planctomycetota bacterium]
MVLAAPSAVAQVRRGIGGPTGVGWSREQLPNDFAAVLHPSEEATTLISRAREGQARGDWKLVVDSLQRIIELPGDHVLASSETMYESARLHAQRRLGSLPPEGLRAYRLIYDGEANAMFSRAREEHDEAVLRRLVDRSLLTSVGDDAAVTLADWLMDEGRFLEAGVFLRLVQSVYPDSDLPRWVVPLRLAVCMVGMNRPARAQAILEESAAGPAGNTPEVAARIARVRAYMAGAAATQPVDGPRDWPMAYGRPSRDGYMAAVEPSLDNPMPWSVPLPVPQPKAGIETVEEFATQRDLMPMADLVTDGRMLVVKSGPSLLGLDAATFEPVWAGRTEQEEGNLLDLESTTTGQGFMMGISFERSARDHQLSNDPLVRQLYYDWVGSQVCLADGLALTIEWPGDPPNTVGLRRDRGLRPRGPAMAGSGQTQPNFVAAYAIGDGRRVWTSDTSWGANALGPLEFLAAPIEVALDTPRGSAALERESVRGESRVADLLLAPCRVNDDLYAVLLDARTGRIARHIYLCGTGGAPFDSLYGCLPSAADGVVFVPTGRGVLVAIDVAGWSIRWAVRYDPASAPVNAMTWLPSPPMAVSDVVVLAPPDADALFGIDRASGEVRWRAPRDNGLYLLAASDELAWTVGEDARAIDVETGGEVWKQPCGPPAGRGARSGNRLYLPTRSSLLVLDATSGKPVEGQPPALIPPGNLLACEGSLYVASAFEVRNYPDMKRGYERAAAVHRQDPADAAAAMRLAWLEYLRGRPQGALAALSRVPVDVRSQDERRYARLVHLKVLAMLELASAPETSVDEALRLLREAQSVALTKEDAITARLALGDHFHRSKLADGNLRACLEYLAVALDDTGDEMISEESGAYQRRAGLVAARRVADTIRDVPAAQVDTLAAGLNNRVAGASAANNIAQLRRISNCGALARADGQATAFLARAGAQADLALAILAARDLAFEQAEACLDRVLRRTDAPELRAEAAARLAAIYLLPDELHQPVLASTLLDRLEHELASVQVPTDVLLVEMEREQGGQGWPPPKEDGQDARPPGRRLMAAGEAARVLRGRIDRGILARHEAGLGPVMIGPIDGRAPEGTNYAGARPILTRAERCEPLADRMLLLVDERTVEARRLDDGELLWPAELRLLGELVVESRMASENARLGPAGRPTAVQPARAVVSGQTLVINTRFGIHAVGLLTGRRLWSRRFDPPTLRSEPQTSASVASDACVWAADGYVVSVDSFGLLEAARSEAGAKVLWRRRMPQRQWQTVRAVGEYLVAADAGLGRVDVFKLGDGTYLGEGRFDQPPQAEAMVNIAVVGDVVCGPRADRQVVALELGTPGIERWNVQVRGELSQIFKPSPELVAVADRAGRVQVIE